MQEEDEVVATRAGDISILVGCAVVLVVAFFPAFMSDYFGWDFADWQRVVAAVGGTGAVVTAGAPLKRLFIAATRGESVAYRSGATASDQEGVVGPVGDWATRRELEARQGVVHLLPDHSKATPDRTD